MKELIVSYRDYKNKYGSIKKKQDSYNAEDKTIVLLLDEYQEKAIDFLNKTGSNRDVKGVVDTIKYHMENSDKMDVEERLESNKEWYDEFDGEDEYEDDLRETRESIELLKFIIEKGWYKA